MKILCSIFLLIISAVDTCLSQDTTAGDIFIGKESNGGMLLYKGWGKNPDYVKPANGILLDKGWKFHVGDDPGYAKPGFNDKGWESINPTLDIHELPQIPRSGIVWFRLHFFIDTIGNNQLALMIQQSGASEMYLNGKLIHRFGVLSTNPEKVIAYNPIDQPVSFPVSKAPEQILAVRYALQPHVLYSHFLSVRNKGLNITASTIENSFSEYQRIYTADNTLHIFITGIFLILGILYLVFFLFYPSQKVNLLFSLYGFLQAANYYFLNFRYHKHEIEHWFLYDLILNIVQVVTYLIILFAVYRLFEQRRGWIYYALSVFAITCTPLNFVYGWGWYAHGYALVVLVYLDITRIAFKSMKDYKGASIIAVGGICFLVFWPIFLLQRFNILEDYQLNFYWPSVLSIPVAISIYLGYDFAITNRSLQQKLTEVEKLSEDNLKKEAEKNALALQMAALETKALRAQMNPHFIFNALNAIKKFLLKNDTANADKYLGSFAKLQRLVLDNTRESKVVLENEVNLLELYLRLEHLRFEDRLTYSIYIDEKINPAETEIPSMLIQPFVENAIVHGLQHKAGKGEIKISFCQEHDCIKVVIEDDGIGRAQAASFQKNDVITHKSLATKISQERLLALGKNKNIPSGIEIIDLHDEQKKACGTRVIICIPVE